MPSPALSRATVSGSSERSRARKSVAYWASQVRCFSASSSGWQSGATWIETSAIRDIAKGESATIVELSDVGVPPRALVRIHAVVVGGKDRTGDIAFDYYPSSPQWGRIALYEITGKTWDPLLMYSGLEETGTGW